MGYESSRNKIGYNGGQNDEKSHTKIPRSIRDLSDRFLPTLASAEASFERSPILTLFLGVFLTLSLVPFILYVLTCGFALASYACLALGALLVASIGTIAGLSTLLVPVLIGTGIASGFVTAGIVSTYLLIRLITLVQQDGFSGALVWLSDIKQYAWKACSSMVQVFVPRADEKASASSSQITTEKINVKEEQSNLESDKAQLAGDNPGEAKE